MSTTTSPDRLLEGARVLFVFQTFELGGSERQAVFLAEHLRDACGSVVEVLAADEGGRARELLRAAGISTGSIALKRPHRNLGSWWRLRRLAAVLRRHEVDLLLPVTSTPDVACGLTWRRAGARACVWRQGDSGIALSGRPLERRAARACSLAVANSDDGADFLRDRLGVPAERVGRIVNAVEIPEGPADPGPWRARLGVAADTLLVSMLAHFRDTKDHATLLEAWRSVVDRMETAPLLVLAGLPGRTSAEVEALHDRLDLERHVRLLGPVEDGPGLLQASDLVVLASLKEGTPNVVLEAMARSRAVVATDVPGSREALGPDANDDLVPLKDAEALASRIVCLLGSAETRAAIGARNRRRVEAEYERSHVCAATATLLASVLAEAPPRSG